MENHHLWLVENKVVIHLTKFMTKNLARINIKIHIFPHFTQEYHNFVGLTLNPIIHYKLLQTLLMSKNL